MRLCRGGGTSSRSHSLGCLVGGGVTGAHHRPRDEGSGAGSGIVSSLASRAVYRPDERQRVSCCLSLASGRHSVSQIVPDGICHCPLDGVALGLSGSLLHTRQKEHPRGSAKSVGPGPSNGVVPCFRGRSSAPETRCPSPSMESSRGVRLLPIRPAPSSHLMGHGVGGSKVTSRGSSLATERVVHGPSGPSRSRTSQASESLEPPCTAPHQEISQGPRDPPTSRMELIQRLIQKAGFSRQVTCVIAADLRRSTVSLYRSKWARFLGLCDRQGADPCKTTIPVIAEFFLHLRQELGLSVTVVKGYRAVLNYVFFLTGMHLAASFVVSRMFLHFERSYHPREIRLPDWNLLLVHRCLSRPPFEPLKLFLDKHLTWKMSFLLALASAKRVSELHGLTFRVRHSRGWRLCTFPFLPDFVAKTQNPSIPDSHFEEFSVPSLDKFVGDDRDEFLLCPIWALRKYLLQTEQHRPGNEGMFLSTGRVKNLVSRNTISYWLRSVISMAHVSASGEDCHSLRRSGR